MYEYVMFVVVIYLVRCDEEFFKEVCFCGVGVM